MNKKLKESSKAYLAREHETRVCADGKIRGCFRKLTPQELVAGFWKRVLIVGPDDCWLWQGAKTPMGNNSKDFYGVLSVNGKTERAHRYAYTLAKGPPPKDKPHVLHSCDHGLCCNANHLDAGTHEENMRQALERKRFASGSNGNHGSITHPESRPRGKAASRLGLDDDQVDLMRNLYLSGLLDRTTLQSIFKIKNAGPILEGKSWEQVPMPTEFADVDRKKLHRKNNGNKHRKITAKKLKLIQFLRHVKKLTFREIAERVQISQSCIYDSLQPKTELEIRAAHSDHKVLLAHASRMEKTIADFVKDRKLDKKIASKIRAAIRVSIASHALHLPV